MNPPSIPRSPSVRRSLTKQLTLVVAVIVAVLLGVVLTTGNHFWRNILREEIDARLSAVAESRRDFVQEWIGRQQDRVRLFAARHVLSIFLEHHVAGQEEEPERGYSQANLESHVRLGAALSARIVDRNGHVLQSVEANEAGRDLTGDPVFRDGLKGPAVGWPEQVGGRFVAQIAAPVLPLDGKGATLGVVMLKVDVTSLAEKLRDTTGLGQTGEVLLGARDGANVRFLFPPRHWHETSAVPFAAAPAMAAATEGHDLLSRNSDYRGEPVLAAGRTIGYGGWALVAKIDEAEAYAPITRVLRYGLGIGTVVALLGLGAAWLLARRFTRPIVRLAAAAESVARGNLDITVPVTSETEAGQLTSRFNDMTSALRMRTAERNASEATMRESEHFLQRVTEVTPGVIHIFDLETQSTVFMNRTVASVLGYSAEEVLAMGAEVVPALMHPEDLPRYADHMKRIRALGDSEIADFEHRLRDSSGEWHWFHSRGAVFARDAAGGVRQAIGAAIEITERKKAERTLDTERNRLRTLIDVLPVSIYVKDTESRFLVANVECARALGAANPEELLGKTDADFFPPAIAAAFLEDERKVMAGELVMNLEEASVYPDGSARTEMTTKVALRDSAGTIVGIVGVSRDITQRKRAEDAVRASEALLRSVTDYTDDIIFVKDLNSRTLFMNPAGLRINAVPAEKLIGHTDAEFIRDPAEAARFLADDRRVMESQETLTVEEELTNATGEKRVLLTTKAPRFDAAGNVIGLVGIAHDITARKHAEEEIRQLNSGLEQRVRQRTAELETSNKELEAFSYSVSHDLRAPLRAVSGFVRMLKESYGDKLDAEGHRLIGVVSSEASRMGRLIDDLLAFSRMGRQQVARANIDMAALARAEFETLTRVAPESAPRLDLEPMPPAHGDPAMLRQVFANLLGNAVKFTRNCPAPVIEVGGVSDNGVTTYHVKDNGAGFDDRFVHKLFGVFQRLHTDHEFEGTGIGLALVQRIIHRHGGKVWAEGKTGAGATFYFTLPNPKKSNS